MKVIIVRMETLVTLATFDYVQRINLIMTEVELGSKLTGFCFKVI